MHSGCAHKAQELRKKKCANGSVLFAFQCLECGSPASAWLPHSDERLKGGEVTDWDYEIFERDSAFERAFSVAEEAGVSVVGAKTSIEIYDAIRVKRGQEWRARYIDHLKSDAWREIRRKVLKRAKNICEGCATADATQVHHLTYKNLGRELLWELVAVCDRCHETAHSSGEGE